MKAPIDVDPLRGMQEEEHQQQRYFETRPLLSPSEFSLVLRPDIDSDEHLLPIHESPWTPDGKSWFQAKISLLQGASAAQAATNSSTDPLGERRKESIGVGESGGHSGGDGNVVQGKHTEDESEGLQDHGSGGGAGLAVTLRLEGAGQRRARLEREAGAAMAAEDERSKLVGGFTSRLEKEAAGRAAAVEEARCSSHLAAAAFTVRVGTRCSSKRLTNSY